MRLQILLWALAMVTTPQAVGDWKLVKSGIELKVLEVNESVPGSNARITVVRVDPKLWRLTILSVKDKGATSGHTAREWASEHGLAVVTNAGMFAMDYSTHIGYMEIKGRIASARVNAYQSLAAFDPRDGTASPLFRIFDLDQPGIKVQTIRKSYSSLVQNLRLIKRSGENRWNQQNKKWSEAALGEDENGNVLFIFSRSPFSMYDFNKALLSANIGLIAAQHLEGGPEAQLYMKVDEFELDMFGSYETSFNENDKNSEAWPIPNVLGVAERR